MLVYMCVLDCLIVCLFGIDGFRDTINCERCYRKVDKDKSIIYWSLTFLQVVAPKGAVLFVR